ncbi:MAG TPA: c-type cytochrome, partial [Hyphomicrobium sp.]|nr:c-type cytochrome [Hyphomicrobium sp.]
MYTSRTLLSVFIAALFALSVPVQARDDEDIGTPVTEAELSAFFAILPDGEGLPPGSGNAVQGLAIYAEKCAMCHGEKLEGIYDTGAPPLAGGAKSLATKQPLKTIESYWPYATTLYD